MPVEVILETTAPNTPNNKPGNTPEYCNLSSPPPREVEPLEALARNTTQFESSDETDIEVVSQTSSDIQREINIMIQRVQNSINLDQPTFDGFTYRDLCNINIIHHCTYPHLYQMEPTDIGPSSSQHFPMDVSQGEEEEVEEWVGLSKIMIVFKYIIIISIYYDYNTLSVYSKIFEYR